MKQRELADEFCKTSGRKFEALRECHAAVAPGTLAKAPDTGPHLLVSLTDLRIFADSIAIDLAAGYAHRVVDEDHCADCGEELDAELVFVLRNGRRLHPGCV